MLVKWYDKWQHFEKEEGWTIFFKYRKSFNTVVHSFHIQTVGYQDHISLAWCSFIKISVYYYWVNYIALGLDPTCIYVRTLLKSGILLMSELFLCWYKFIWHIFQCFVIFFSPLNFSTLQQWSCYNW